MPSNKYACIHGHFYQPPRENAWLEIIELQDSATPFHDWNERINFECYAPNSAARILDNEGMIKDIVNNYESISFNFGPTLLEWLEKSDPDAYAAILQADRTSTERFSGHGNAVAQGYNHLIHPLANERDQVTQVRWGIADFEHRFGRKPEGFWLPEAAVDTPTLEVLAAHGIRFTVLAPRQARAYRRLGEKAWTPVHESIDTRRPYRCLLPSGAHIDLFFYDGNVAQDVAFKGLLNDGASFGRRLTSTFDANDEAQLAHIATDGESYGHHHRWGEMALAASLHFIEEHDWATLTNYGEFLEKFPPKFEVQIHENSSWSCVHGVERWRSDCGCNTGSQPGWNQAWRKPLRDALDWLRSELEVLFEKETKPLLRNAWEARNDYITVLLNRSSQKAPFQKRESSGLQKNDTGSFLRRHALRELSEEEKVKILRLMEMQRHAMLMYTSCAWFFAEISGIETNQVLQYALRAMYYANYVAGLELQPEFVKKLEKAPSNIFPNGAGSFLQNVEPAQMNLTRVAMHLAVSSIFEDFEDDTEFLHYEVKNQVFERISAGSQRLAFGRTTVISHLTGSEKRFSYVVLYLGQQNVVGNISLSMTRAEFDQRQTDLTREFRASNLGDMLSLLQEFGTEIFSFKHLFKDEKRKILRQILENSLPPVVTAIRDYYDDNYQLMVGMLASGIPVPESWQNITQFVINQDIQRCFQNGKLRVRTLQSLADEFARWGAYLSDEPGLSLAAGERIFAELKKVEAEEAGLEHLQTLINVLEVLKKLDVEPELFKSQNLYFRMTQGYRRGDWVYVSTSWKDAFLKLGVLLRMGKIAID